MGAFGAILGEVKSLGLRHGGWGNGHQAPRLPSVQRHLLSDKRLVGGEWERGRVCRPMLPPFAADLGSPYPVSGAKGVPGSTPSRRISSTSAIRAMATSGFPRTLGVVRRLPHSGQVTPAA